MLPSARRRGIPRRVVCAAWHQAGIGTVTNLTFGAYVPEIGAALVVVGLGLGIRELLHQRS